MPPPSTEAYRKAASRLSPRLSATALQNLENNLQKSLTGAPASVFSIPDSVRRNPFIMKHAPDGADIAAINPSAAIRCIGTSRRVFLLSSSLTPTEISGLSYRLRTLSSNGGINSIVIANPLEDVECNGDMTENETCLPLFMEEGELKTSVRNEMGGSEGPWGERHDNSMKTILHDRFGEGLGIPYVSSGYDARQIYALGMHADPSRLDSELLTPLMELSASVRGSFQETVHQSRSKVPVISLPHGLVTDAGYSLLLGSYVLATHSTSFRILNPLRGLAFDPIGLSYLLPRLGWEFSQPSAPYATEAGLLLALGGCEANAHDMVSTGLATHYVGGPYKLNILERGLADLNSYENQSLRSPRTKLYGREREDTQGPDVNERYKNVAVGNLIQHLSEYDAAEADEYGCRLDSELDDETGLYLRDKDPSLTLDEDRIQMYEEVHSPLVTWAATLEGVWEEGTVVGAMERLREIAASKAGYEHRSGCEEDVLVAETAQAIVSNMEQRSPLALCVMHRLMLLGSQEGETLESCMEREKASQLRLFTKEDGDYVRWAESGKGVGLVGMMGCSSLIRVREDVFNKWNHNSVKEVTEDEIREIIGT